MPVRNLGRTITQIAVSQGAAGATDLVAAPGTGFKIYVVTIALSADAAGTLKFTEGTGPTDLSGAFPVAANGGFVITGDGFTPVLQTNTANAKLSIVSVTSKISGYIRYYTAPNE